MVKIVNEFGNILIGKQDTAIYQRHYGRQIRRVAFERKDEPSPVEQENRNNFKNASQWVKNLSAEEKAGLKLAYEQYKEEHPNVSQNTWSSFGVFLYITKPEFRS